MARSRCGIPSVEAKAEEEGCGSETSGEADFRQKWTKWKRNGGDVRIGTSKEAALTAGNSGGSQRTLKRIGDWISKRQQSLAPR
jgi:hypothetical protein